MNWEKFFVVLLDGKPSRYYKDGQIKTYMTRANAEREARKIMHRYTKVEVGKFSATEIIEVTKEESE